MLKIRNILIIKNEKMKNQTVELYIEKGEDGVYWGTSKNLPGVVSTYGNTLPELRSNFLTAYDDYLEVAKENKEAWANDLGEIISFTYKFNLVSLFKMIPEIKITALAKKAKINESLMRQYATGKETPSEERAMLIQKTIHELGKELMSVNL